eukprot:6186042-Pleurochrysis_carterae.AAC.4
MTLTDTHLSPEGLDEVGKHLQQEGLGGGGIAATQEGNGRGRDPRRSEKGGYILYMGPNASVGGQHRASACRKGSESEHTSTGLGKGVRSIWGIYAGKKQQRRADRDNLGSGDEGYHGQRHQEFYYKWGL